MNNALKITVSLPILASIAGCGGGPQSMAKVAALPPPVALPAIPKPVTTPVSTNFDTAEYQLSPTAKYSNAIEAWQNGATGRGIKIGIVDTGLNPTLAEFAGRIDPASDDVAGNRGMGDLWGHGTGVASIAAGARNDAQIVGIAYEASIVMLRADNPGTCPEACTYRDEDIAQGIDAARRAGARVINLSIGGDTDEGIRDAVKKAAAAGIVIVVAAGNASPWGAPSNFALDLVAAAPANVIVVGAVGAPDAEYANVDYDQLNQRSSGAYAARNFYLAAPGGMVWFTDQNGNLDRGQATSFAAPVVAGAVALLAQAFPMLTGQQIAQILFTTADDLGATGIDELFGWGRLNIGRSFQPIGKTSAAGSEVEVSTLANGVAPAVAGDALSRASGKAIVLDSYHRPFDLELGKTVQQAAAPLQLHRRLSAENESSSASVGGFSIAMTMRKGIRAMSNDPLKPLSLNDSEARQARLLAGSVIRRLGSDQAIAMGIAESAQTLEDRLSAAQTKAFLITPDTTRNIAFQTRSSASVAVRQDLGKTTLIASAERGKLIENPDPESRDQFSLVSVSAQREILGNHFLLRATHVNEDGTIMGGRLGPIFKASGAKSAFLDIEAERAIGRGWTLRGGFRQGWSWFDSGEVGLSGYSFSLTKAGLWSANDLLTFQVSQPLAVTTGGFDLTLPTGWDYQSQTATVAATRFSLAPRRRELASELGYETALPGGHFGGNLFVRINPGHSSSSTPDIGAAVRFALRL